MAVVQITTWQPATDRTPEVLQHMTDAKKIHERLGAAVSASQAIAAGAAATTISYAMWFDSRKAWGAFSDALARDADWQKFVQQVLAAPNPTARLLSNITAADVAGFEQPVPRPAAGEVLNRSMWRPSPGRFGDILRDLAEWQKIAAGAGVTGLRFLLSQDAGTDTGLLMTAFRCPNFETYGALGDKLFADPQFQAFYMHLMDSGASTLVSQSVSQFLPI